MSSDRPWIIYTLSDPQEEGVRYVGVTHQTPERRLALHLRRAKEPNKYHLTNWIRKLVDAGRVPVITVIESGSGPCWGPVEMKWIAWYREQGADLTNATNGGEGAPGHVVSAEAREKMAASRRGKPLSPEHKAKLRAANVGKKMSPEAIAKTAAFWTGRKHSPETKAKIAAAKTGRAGWIPTQEIIAKRAVSIQAALEKKRAEGWIRVVTAEQREKISAGNKGKKRSPETRARMSVAAKASCARRKEAS